MSYSNDAISNMIVAWSHVFLVYKTTPVQNILGLKPFTKKVSLVFPCSDGMQGVKCEIYLQAWVSLSTRGHYSKLANFI